MESRGQWRVGDTVLPGGGPVVLPLADPPSPALARSPLAAALIIFVASYGTWKRWGQGFTTLGTTFRPRLQLPGSI